MTLHLVRHAVAMRRRDWTGADDLRPLTQRGRRQAEALVDWLRPRAVSRVVSSPSVRCVDTVHPFAAAAGLALSTRDDLREGSGLAVLALLRSIASENVVVCSHGDVLLELLDALAGHARAVNGPSLDTFAKGAVWVVDGVPDDVVATYEAPLA
ncbi:MAG TPA: phosphoglycerate mutase family protein [Acidimicrobiales bacterium]|nr:phosphoglycerate mutase family protein [Acidimicrobiales bacterium]